MLAKIEELIARNIYWHRTTRLGLTLAKAAELCNVPMSTYVRAEDYEHPIMPSVPTLESIARGFGIDSATLGQDMSRQPTPSVAAAFKALAEAAGLTIDGRITEAPPVPALSDRDRRILDVLRGLNDEDLNFVLEDVVPDVIAGLDRRTPNTSQGARVARKPQKG